MAIPVDVPRAERVMLPPLPKSGGANVPSFSKQLPVELPSLQPLSKEVLPYVSTKPKKAAKQTALEQTIGLKWAGWVGAVVLLIGAALGVKYAYDQHWFGQLPVWIWPSIIAFVGFALIGAGEWVYRKVNVIPGASLFGAGVATLFLVSYVGHAYYQLYSPSTAFVLMAMTTLIGSAVAMRGGLVSIAVLSQIGGNVAPLVMGSSGAPHSTFMTYLLMLQVIALVLAWWGRSPRWWTLRGVSLGTTALWIGAIIAGGHDGMLPLWFGIGYAILYHVEVIASAMRADRQTGESIDVRHGGAVFVTLVTGGLTAVILSVLADSTAWTRADWIVGLAAVCEVIGVALKQSQGKLKRSLVDGYSVCGAALVTLAIPIAFSGHTVEIGWAALAIAMAAMGRTTKSKIAQAGAIVAWMLVLVHLVCMLPAIDIFSKHPAREVWLTIDGVEIVSATILAWGLALVGHVIAGVLARDAKPVTKWVSGIASVVWILTSIESLPPLGASLSLVGYAWLMLGADIALPALGLAVHSVAVLLLTTVKWVAVDTLGQRLSPDWSAAQYVPVLNPMMGIGVLLAGSLLAVYWLRRESLERALSNQRRAPLTAVVTMLVIALLAVAFSFEIDRVVERAVLAQRTLAWPVWQIKQMAWTMLWSVSALVFAFIISRLISLGTSRRMWLGWIVIFAGLLVAKFVIIDTLIYRMFWPVGTAGAVVNLQTMTAAVVVASLGAMQWIAGNVERDSNAPASLGSRFAMLALFVVAWTGTFEIERFVVFHPGLVSPWSMEQFKQMAWTMWWIACAAGGFVIGLWLDRNAIPEKGWAKSLPRIVMILAVKFMVVDALFWRIIHRVTLATVVANVQTLTAAIVMGGLILIVTLGLPGSPEATRQRRVRAGFMALILTLLAVSLEIDRFFEGPGAAGLFTDPRLAKQVAFSIAWSLFAVGSVAGGFGIRLASLRYFGLTLLAVTLLKVVTVDLSQISTGYRILSFLGLGLLMLGTSVLYGKLSPKLLKSSESATVVT